MIEPIRIFRWEGLGLFALAAVAVARRALFSREILAGLLQDRQRRVSPYQVQLLIVTLVFAVRYLWQLTALIVGGTHAAMPGVQPAWLVALGLSGAVYATGGYLGVLRASNAGVMKKEV